MMIIVLGLAAAWIGVGIHAYLRNRREGRPDNSVLSFRAQLSTLERATPGSMLRQPTGQVPVVRLDGARPAPSSVKRRRRDVLIGLMGATVFSFLLLVVMQGAFATLAFLASAGSLVAYVYALRQLHLRSMERSVKVRSIAPRHSAATMDLRRTIAN